MAKTITITDISLESVQLSSTTDADGLHLFVGLGFNMIANGLTFHDVYTKELTGTRRTQVITFLQNLKQDILTDRGIA